MTSDAKVGLLLGLVFIVIIAFLINGLPSLMADGGGEDAFETLVAGSNENLALGSRADDAVQAIQNSLFPPQEPRQVPLESLKESDKRFGNGGQDEILEHFKVVKVQKPPRPKERIYTVRDGDSLGAIAKAVYGSEEGNRRAIVQNLFEANKGILKSPDDLLVGQKLKVPSLSALSAVPNAGGGAVGSDDGVLGKLGDAIKNVFNKPKPPEYVIKDGDSLWAIATKMLGDGNRYHEIKSLNKEIYDEEELYVGMRLRLPKR